MSFNWDTDWEDTQISWQDPAVAEMFYRAYRERLMDWATPAQMSNFNLPSMAATVQGFWLELMRLVYNLGNMTYTQFDIDGGTPQTWIQAGKWPPPKGFRRIFPFVINKFSDPVKDGWVARFEVVNGITPDGERIYSGRRFKGIDGQWVETDEYLTVLKSYGRPRAGDYMGGHTLNDIKECINLAVYSRLSPRYHKVATPKHRD